MEEKKSFFFVEVSRGESLRAGVEGGNYLRRGNYLQKGAKVGRKIGVSGDLNLTATTTIVKTTTAITRARTIMAIAATKITITIKVATRLFQIWPVQITLLGRHGDLT